MTRCAPLKALTFLGVAAVIAGAACTPTVQMKAPDEPITINLNVKLESDVRTELQKQAEADIEENPEIF